MTHEFGHLLTQHLHRKHGLSQAKLAAGIWQDPAVIARMCKGERLQGVQARERIVAIIGWLHAQSVLSSLADADALLEAAGMSGLSSKKQSEARLLEDLDRTPAHGDQLASKPSQLQPTPHNLPRQTTSFIGREDELVDVAYLLELSSLLTLTGVGGAGKTRLANEVGLAVLPDYPDGVCLVQLAALKDASFVPHVVLQAASVHEQPDKAIEEQLEQHFRSKCCLLILDNCEHLLAACAPLAHRLLQSSAHLTILATSREPLGISGETIWQVRPLSLTSAQELFVARSKAMRPALTWDDQSNATLRDICRRLDGIPLAIELAASRTYALSLQAICDRLSDRFELLRGGSRAELPRHQTLQLLIDWSYDLLTEHERAMFQQLSVFAGSWTLEAAEVICRVHDSNTTTVSLIAQLVSKSLVVMIPEQDRGAPVRYMLLETLREYAYVKLAQSGELQALTTAYSEYFAGFAEQVEPQLHGPQQKILLDRLELDLANFRSAIQLAIDANLPEVAARLGVSLWHYWYVRLHHQEGMRCLKQILAMPLPRPYRAKLLYGLGMLARRVADDSTTYAYVSEALELFRIEQDAYGVASCLRVLGFTDYRQVHLESAQQKLEEALLLFRQMDHTEGVAAVLANLAYIKMVQLDWASARSFQETSLRLRRNTGNLHAMTVSLDCLGAISVAQNDLGAAKDHLLESIELNKRAGNLPATRVARSLLGLIDFNRGELEQAHFECSTAYDFCQNSGNLEIIALAEVDLALVSHYLHNDHDAWRLLNNALRFLRSSHNLEHQCRAFAVVAMCALSQGELVNGLQIWAHYCLVRPHKDLEAPYARLFADLRLAVANAQKVTGQASAVGAQSRGETMPNDQLFDDMLKLCAWQAQKAQHMSTAVSPGFPQLGVA